MVDVPKPNTIVSGVGLLCMLHENGKKGKEWKVVTRQKVRKPHGTQYLYNICFLHRSNIQHYWPITECFSCYAFITLLSAFLFLSKPWVWETKAICSNQQKVKCNILLHISKPSHVYKQYSIRQKYTHILSLCCSCYRTKIWEQNI